MPVLRVRNVHYQQINFSPANYNCDGGIQSSDTVRRNSIAVVTPNPNNGVLCVPLLQLQTPWSANVTMLIFNRVPF